MRSITRRVRIIGTVQGVSFRAWTQHRAEAAGLAGWVRNEDDGSVTALFSGPQEAVERMIMECQEGPGAAVVRDVQAEPADPPDHADFRIG